MKVYANSEKDRQILLSYLGKDAWIRCTGKFWDYEFYVRMISARTDENYIINKVYCADVPELNNEHYTEIFRALNERCNWNIDVFTPCKPLDVRTTKELFPELPNISDAFTKFIGKDVWVKVRTWGYDDQQDYYIRILSKNDYTFTCNYMEACTVEGTDEYYAEYTMAELMQDMKNPHKFSLDTFELDTPIEAYSTEEVLSMIRDAWEAAGGYMTEEEEE